MITEALVPAPVSAINTLKRNYDEMLETGRLMRKNRIKPDSLDNYYHTKAHYEVAQKGTIPAIWGQLFGVGKEVFDVVKNRAQGKSVEQFMPDVIKDLQNNMDGASVGLYNQQPAEKNTFLESKKTPALRILEEMLK